MTGFLGQLANTAARGVTAWDAGRAEQEAELIKEKARQAAEARLKKQDERQARLDQLLEEKAQRDAVIAGYRPPETTVTTAPPELPPGTKPASTFGEAAVRLSEPPAPKSALETPITQGSLGSIPNVGVQTTPARFEDPQLIRQAAREAQAEKARLANIQAQKERDDRQQTNAMKRIDKTQGYINSRDGAGGSRAANESLTRFNVPLDRAADAAMASYNQSRAKAGLPPQKPTPQDLSHHLGLVVSRDPVLSSHWNEGRITGDMINGTVTRALAPSAAEARAEAEKQAEADALKNLPGYKPPAAAPAAAPSVQRDAPKSVRLGAPPVVRDSVAAADAAYQRAVAYINEHFTGEERAAHLKTARERRQAQR